MSKVTMADRRPRTGERVIHVTGREGVVLESNEFGIRLEMDAEFLFLPSASIYRRHWSYIPETASTVVFLQSRIEQLEAALTELVALKDSVKEADPADYERRKPLAWEAARKALASGQIDPMETAGSE